jgi:hypothetical protein
VAVVGQAQHLHNQVRQPEGEKAWGMQMEAATGWDVEQQGELTQIPEVAPGARRSHEHPGMLIAPY